MRLVVYCLHASTLLTTLLCFAGSVLMFRNDSEDGRDANTSVCARVTTLNEMLTAKLQHLPLMFCSENSHIERATHRHYHT